MPTTNAVAAPLTASAWPPGQSARSTTACDTLSKWLTMPENSAKPLMTATVATALGTDKRKMSLISPRTTRVTSKGLKFLR
jgi:hypothetical protein